MRSHPTVLKYRSDLGKTYINLSGLESKAGRPGQAVALLGPARDHLRQVFRLRSGDPAAREALSTACVDLAGGLMELGRHAEALEVYRECAGLELELVRTKDSRLSPDRNFLRSGLVGMALSGVN